MDLENVHKGATKMENLFWPVALGVPGAVVVVAVALTFWALGEKKNGKVMKNEEHEGIIK